VIVTEIQKARKTDRVYRLKWNIDHLIDNAEVDGWLRESAFPNAPSNSIFWEIKENLILPNPVIFDVIGEVFEIIDYPYLDVRWPIMSQRMLDTLLSLGNFRYRAYPLLMVDCEQIYNEELGTKAASGIVFENFFAVHLLEDLDVLDLENSIYERGKRNPDAVINVEKTVFIEPPTGFPPLFRAVHLENYLYVSAEARSALEKAGIRGVDFVQVENEYTVVSSLP
jgi:hypothetical protein